jgi:hypothetical protein
MTAELYVDDTHLNVSGDLPSLLEAVPMFRRVVAGYDRFQVDTYVRWAEDELATAARERDHLLARHLRTWTELEEARQLLSHSTGGGEFLQASRRIGTMLAAAADEAERITAEARAARAHAAGQATRAVARAEKALADADAEAGRRLAEAAAQVETATSRARRIIENAAQPGREIRAEADARLERARGIEQRAAEDADRLRRQAAEVGAAARLQARSELVSMLAAAREQRIRSDTEAAAARERLDRDAAARRSAVLADVAALERRCAALRADEALLVRRPFAEAASATQVRPLPVWLNWRSRSVRAR